LGIKNFTNGSLGDAPQYIRYVESFRSNENIEYPDQPFSYRPLIPLLAAPLPFEAMTSLNIINTLLLMLTLFYFIKMMRFLEIPNRAIIYASLLFVISFPVFYYGSVGRIDTVGLFVIIFGTYHLYRKRLWLTVLSIITGAFGKEIVIALVPIIFMYYLFEHKDLKKAFMYAALGGVSFVFASKICQYFFGIGANNYSPVAGMETFLFNIKRPRTWISGTLSFGIPGALSLLIVTKYLINKKKEELKSVALPLLSILMFFALFIISLISAYSDGRFIWPASIFSCWIVAYHLKTIFESAK
jgi:hypothetical protein